MGGSTDSVCVYTAATELHLSSYVHFMLQAVNYPSMFVLFTALENSFKQIRWIMLTEQLFMLLMLVDSLALHLICTCQLVKSLMIVCSWPRVVSASPYRSTWAPCALCAYVCGCADIIDVKNFSPKFQSESLHSA